MGFKKWSVAKYDKAFAKSLAEECDVEPIVALVSAARGYTDPSDLEQFLTDEPYFTDIDELIDIDKAADILNSEIEKGTKIAIYGDYDTDGVTSTVLMLKYLKSRNADCTYYIPSRFTEGYGMNKNAIDKLISQNVGLIITVDNGITALDEIEYAKSKGIKIIVTDHHLPLDTLPCADAIVDPHRKDCSSTFKSICGVEVAYKLICKTDCKEPEELLYEYSDLLSVGLIGDVMPLINENRSIVKYGLKKFKNDVSIGFSALINSSGLLNENNKEINAVKIAFGVVPRINAAGRMGDAKRAVDLLLSENMLEALKLANELNDENTLRQQTEKTILKEAIEKIEKNKFSHNRIIVVEGENWHHGIVGIVASRITEKYGCPSIVISVDNDGFCHGSGRAYQGYSLYNIISSGAKYLEKFGGHELAAGLTIKAENINLFRKSVNDYMESLQYVPPVLNIDLKLNPKYLSVDLAESLRVLEPFGCENQTPVFAITKVTLETITPIGQNKHLRLEFSRDDVKFKALLFGVSTDTMCFCVGDVLDVAVTIDANVFNGNTNLSVIIKAIRMNSTVDSTLFNDLFNYNNFLDNRAFDKNLLTPTREEVGAVYKYILSSSPVVERVSYCFLNSIGYAKSMISLKILKDLSLIKIENNKIIGIRTTIKTDLTKSDTYNKLIGDE